MNPIHVRVLEDRGVIVCGAWQASPCRPGDLPPPPSDGLWSISADSGDGRYNTKAELVAELMSVAHVDHARAVLLCSMAIQATPGLQAPIVPSPARTHRIELQMWDGTKWEHHMAMPSRPFARGWMAGWAARIVPRPPVRIVRFRDDELPEVMEKIDGLDRDLQIVEGGP